MSDKATRGCAHYNAPVCRATAQMSDKKPDFTASPDCDFLERAAARGPAGEGVVDRLWESEYLLAEAVALKDTAVEEYGRARDRVEELEATVWMLLTSAHPHPKEHPTMSEAWAAARAVLDRRAK